MKKRPYRLGRRADNQQETRRRIVEATVDLHETLGPRATTISAIAERAGVQRLTVYRHFPDENALFDACSSHWMAAHPPPDPADWRSINDGGARCRAALTACYRYYRANADMLASLHRDSDMPEVSSRMGDFANLLRAAGGDLLAAVAPPPATAARVAATLAHVLAFPTWQSLAVTLDDDAIIDLALAWLDGAAASPAPPG